MLEGPAGTGKTLVALQVANNLLESLTDTCDSVEKCKRPILVVTAHAPGINDPIMKYLDENSASESGNKIFRGWHEMIKEFDLPDWSDLIDPVKALAKSWEGRDIVILVDEIINIKMLSHIGDKSIPESIRMIVIVNPSTSLAQLTLPPSFLQVTLTTPYRSTIAITSLACFIAKCKGLTFPEGDFGSDVEGVKPVVFDVGQDGIKFRYALAQCCKLVGEDATILYASLPPHQLLSILRKGKEVGGSWNCHKIYNFYGWEADRVVAVICEHSILEMITRARTHLCVILVERKDIVTDHLNPKEFFQQAAGKGLVEMKYLHRFSQT